MNSSKNSSSNDETEKRGNIYVYHLLGGFHSHIWPRVVRIFVKGSGQINSLEAWNFFQQKHPLPKDADTNY